jgi:carbonic anhydrase
MLLEQFWPSRRCTQFDEFCSSAASRPGLQPPVQPLSVRPWRGRRTFATYPHPPEQEITVSVTDELLANNVRYAASFSGPLPLPPSKHVAVVACMDARLNVYAILGLGDGEAHVIRNAGGVVTDDEIRSLAISQRLLGTEEIILIHHTDCGMLTFTDDAFKRTIQQETGIKPEWAAEAFDDLAADVRQSIARIKANPFVPKKDAIRGFVFDVATGKLNEVV